MRIYTYIKSDYPEQSQDELLYKRDKLHSYARSSDMEIVKGYIDRGVCSEYDWHRRPSFAGVQMHMLDNYHDPPVKHLLIQDLVEISVQPHIAQFVVFGLENQGITVLGSEGRDYTKPDTDEEKMIREIFKSMGQYEREASRSNMKRGLMRHRRDGTTPKTNGAFGWRKGEKETLLLIKELEKQHYSNNMIADELNSRLEQDGWPVPRIANKWTHGIISRILKKERSNANLEWRIERY